MNARPAIETGGFWGVGRYRDTAGAWCEIELTSAEFDREVDAAEVRLRSWNVGRHDIVLLIGGVAEAAQLAPFQRAARRLEAITVTAEATEFDARRVAAILERFTLRVLIGLDASVLRGLAQLGDVKTVLGRCENLIVRDDAYAATAELGLAPAALQMLGPATAMECPQRSGSHLDPRAWTATANGDRIEVRPAANRDLAVEPVVSERPGRILAGPCACGSDDPRVILDRQ
jgi:hypothetical protein